MATTKAKTTSKPKEEKTTELTELEILKQQLEELQRLVNSREPEEEVSVEGIDPRKYIRVMSLLPYPLNLSTEPNGRGKIKRFTDFGEIKRILYADLVDIIDNHPTFLEAGYFYILDKNVIRAHGLDDVYKRVLSKEKIEKVLSADTDEAVDLFELASEGQREIIVQFFIEIVANNPDSVNLNVVDRISRISGRNITEMASDYRALEQLKNGEPEGEEE